MDQNIINEIAKKFDKPPDEVKDITTEFLKLLHKVFYEEYEDFFGAPLMVNAGREGYFHFIGMIELFVRRYSGWEPGNAQQYTGRLGLEEDWEPFFEEMKKWKEREF